MPDARVLVVYESIYGNTRAVAEAIAEGLAPLGSVEVRSVFDPGDSGADAVDLLVVGGPTHMHGITSSFSRKAAVQAGEEDGAEIVPGARDGRGLRKWLGQLSGKGRKAAAFDTRIDRSPTLTGAASRSIARRLHGRGFELVADRESFFVEDSEGPLAEGELERARSWGAKLADMVGT
jgi:Flavodoxin domain